MGDMHGLQWLTDNWVTILNAVGIIGGLSFTGYSLHSEAKTRRIANLLTLTQSHRDVWRELIHNPRLSRILDSKADITHRRVTTDEEIFVNLVIQHVSIVYHAMRDDLTIPPDGLRRDIWEFFSLPIPHAIWDRVKFFQNDSHWARPTETILARESLETKGGLAFL